MRTLFVAAIVLWVNVSNAVVHEVEHMQPALDAVKSDTLLIFDLDNTLIEPTQMLGTDQWFEHEVKSLAEAKSLSGMNPKEATSSAIKEALTRWMDIQRVTDVVAVEPGVAQRIAELQKSGVKVLGLTARPPALAETTAKQLKSIGVDFNLSPVTPSALVFEKGENELLGGILYIGPESTKGTELVRLLTKLKMKPSRIVFADDKKRHVDSVEKALAGKGMDYHGYRYSMADPHVKAFNPQIAAQQLKHFGGILSDKEAKLLSELEKIGTAP